MYIQRFIGGALAANGYIIYQKKGGDCYIIDPGYNGKKYTQYIKENKLSCKGIILTHLHHDHCGSANQVSEKLSCPIYMHTKDAVVYKGTVHETLEDGDCFNLDGETLRVIWTPGHTEGGICIMGEKSKVCFTGDTIFDTDLGRTDLPGGSQEAMRQSICSKVNKWGNDVTIYPGHEDGCTMKTVRAYNTEFLQLLPKEAIKMVALDLDGTTIGENRRISDRTVRDFKLAMEQGVHIVISTGRTYQSLPKQLFEIEGLEYIITSNGACITKLPEKKIVYENFLKPEAVEEIAGIVEHTGFSIETFVDGTAYIDKEVYDDVVANGSSFRDAAYIINTRHPVEHIFSFLLRNKERIENISINFPNLGDKQKIKDMLAEVKSITLTSSFPRNFEIGGETTSKGEALKFLMKELSMDKNQLMACGDSPNDLRMLELASIGVVMGNASDEIKAKADYVTDTNKRDGVAKAIEKFVLK